MRIKMQNKIPLREKIISWKDTNQKKDTLSRGCLLFLIMKNSISVRCVRLNIDIFASFLTGSEHNNSVDESEESVILTHTYVKTGMVDSATLTFDDVTGFTVRTTKNFHSKSFAF